MTANPPQTSPKFGPSPKVKAQVDELQELAKQFPEPTWEEVMPDWQWLYAECNAGRLFDLFGKFVAVCEKNVLGTDDDELALRIRMSKDHQRHPERFVITFLGDWTVYDQVHLKDSPMSVNSTQKQFNFGHSLRVQAKVNELRILEKQFPEPKMDAVMADWEWLYAQSGTPVMEPYFEQLVAVYDCQIVGSDPEDELALRIRLARELQRHPERFVISYVG